MKFAVAILLAAALFARTQATAAETIVFGAPGAEFTLTVPAGYTVDERDDCVTLSRGSRQMILTCVRTADAVSGTGIAAHPCIGGRTLLVTGNVDTGIVRLVTKAD